MPRFKRNTSSSVDTVSSASKSKAGRDSARRGVTRYDIAQAAMLGALWIAFSGKLDPLHIGFGVFSIAVVLVLTRHMRLVRGRHDWLGRLSYRRAALYPFWMLWEIVLANIQVARLILSPKLDIDPVVLEFRFPIDCPMTKVTLGNSITLTPGTFTLRIDGDRFVVHAITRESAELLLDGTMQRKAAALFGNTLESVPEVTERPSSRAES